MSGRAEGRNDFTHISVFLFVESCKSVDVHMNSALSLFSCQHVSWLGSVRASGTLALLLFVAYLVF